MLVLHGRDQRSTAWDGSPRNAPLVVPVRNVPACVCYVTRVLMALGEVARAWSVSQRLAWPEPRALASACSGSWCLER
jgi:hypothetical protein